MESPGQRTEEQEQQIRCRIVQVLKETRISKIRIERKIERVTKFINWYILTKANNPQILTREDQEKHIEFISERNNLRLEWEDKIGDIEYLEGDSEYLEEKALLSEIGGTWD